MKTLLAALLLTLTTAQDGNVHEKQKSVAIAMSDQQEIKIWLLSIENAQLRLDKAKSDASVYVQQLYAQYGVSQKDYDFNAQTMTFTLKEEK